MNSNAFFKLVCLLVVLASASSCSVMSLPLNRVHKQNILKVSKGDWVAIHANPIIGDYAKYKVYPSRYTLCKTIENIQNSAVFVSIKTNIAELNSSPVIGLREYYRIDVISMEGYVLRSVLVDPITNKQEDWLISPVKREMEQWISEDGGPYFITTDAGLFFCKMMFSKNLISGDYTILFVSPDAPFLIVRSFSVPDSIFHKFTTMSIHEKQNYKPDSYVDLIAYRKP